MPKRNEQNKKFVSKTKKAISSAARALILTSVKGQSFKNPTTLDSTVGEPEADPLIAVHRQSDDEDISDKSDCLEDLLLLHLNEG